ncbi:MAG: SDR family oxidoreductase [Alphaproteobacteria bacterium]|jgi:3-oxoacyl-[acyl-carrier protein] reductase|nr:SDR family oxidoreductase [Alphaproteobacteria bacterium]MDG2490901.1 SDR family oxidoreductase [Alphaproteobacteria bacterium]
MNFAGKTVLITGASRGIGAAIAEAFAAENASVVVNYLQNVQAAEATVAACNAKGGNALAVQADVTDPVEARRLVAKTEDVFGKIDVLVHNAFAPFIFSAEQRKLFWDLDWDAFQAQIDGSVKAAHGMVQAVLPKMLERAEGTIITIATNLIANPLVPYHDYTTAKSALVGFSRNLAMELGPLGIRVNTVCPGLVYPTAASRHVKEKLKTSLIAQTPMRRIATPEDVAGPVLFLASSWARFMTGQTLYVDGGVIMR